VTRERGEMDLFQHNSIRINAGESSCAHESSGVIFIALINHHRAGHVGDWTIDRGDTQTVSLRNRQHDEREGGGEMRRKLTLKNLSILCLSQFRFDSLKIVLPSNCRNGVWGK
jgi:hypothetical protein